MTFIDASALIAMIARERQAADLAERLAPEADRICSALSAWETMAGLRRSHGYTIGLARTHLGNFFGIMRIRYVAVGEREYQIAADAYARFGRGRHPAGLNMGDCFAYACAKAHDARLLFVGDDFARTDIACC